jgi:hypothetical protein
MAGNALSKREAQGHVTPSWKRAEDLLNEARRAAAQPPVDGLSGSGGEGEISDRARDALQEIGWNAKAQDHGHADPAHTDSHRDAPPAAQDSPEWERQAHEEAERNRLS